MLNVNKNKTKVFYKKLSNICNQTKIFKSANDKYFN